MLNFCSKNGYKTYGGSSGGVALQTFYPLEIISSDLAKLYHSMRAELAEEIE